MTLEFQPRPPNRRWLVIGWAVITIVVAAACVAYFEGPTLAAHVRLRLLMRKCLDWQMPPDTVVYQCFPEAATDLVNKQPALYRLNNCGAAREIDSWNDLRGSLRIPRLVPPAILFIHERQAAGAPPRLVVIEALDFQVGEHDWSTWQPITGMVLDPGGAFGRPRVITAAPIVTDELTARWLKFAGFCRDGPTFLAGQPDMADPSHFTVGWVIDGITESLDGWLLPDDRVRITLHDPAGTRKRMVPRSGANEPPGNP
jgi:hypothetical protein